MHRDFTKGMSDSADTEAKTRKMLQDLGCHYVDFEELLAAPIVLQPHHVGMALWCILSRVFYCL
jgi:hypothetical protein